MKVFMGYSDIVESEITRIVEWQIGQALEKKR